MTDQEPQTTPDTATPPGYYDDGHGRSRYWDGNAWTETVEKKPGRKLPLWVGAVAGGGALLLGIAVGSASGVTTRSALAEAETQITQLEAEVSRWETRDSDLDNRESQLDDREADLAAREEAVTAVEDQIAANTIPGSGVYLVGTDIQPGRYRSTDNSSCYWARLSGLSGGFGDIIANDNVNGQAVVQIKSSDTAFETSRCSDWVKID